jgi:hypothetical protein
MPEQNRVTPTGTLERTPLKLEWMGNRGELSRPNTWATRRWIMCTRHVPGREGMPFTRKYTRLFFVDEATAFAAGHRPCFECLRERAKAFRHAWVSANRPDKNDLTVTFDEIDSVLHTERALSGKPDKSLLEGSASILPNGTVVEWTHDVG